MASTAITSTSGKSAAAVSRPSSSADIAWNAAAGKHHRAEKDKTRMPKFDVDDNTMADLLVDLNLSPTEGNIIKTEEEEGTVAASASASPSASAAANSDDNSSIKHIDPNTTRRTKGKKMKKGGPRKASTKSQLHDMCAKYKWKSPIYQCWKEEGPCHMKLYTFKVVIEIEESTDCRVLECYGAPKPTKKTAADHAAEGAMWCLKHLGYHPNKKHRK